MPDEGIDAVGYALHLAQLGGKHEDAKVLKGFGGAGVLEVIENHQGDTKARSGHDPATLKVGPTRCREMTMTSEQIESGSGNVYADLDLPNANEMRVKADLVMRIAHLLKDKGLKQTAAASLLGLSQPKLSGLLRGQFRGVSESKLIECLTRLGQDVEIVVRAAPKCRGEGRVLVTAE